MNWRPLSDVSEAIDAEREASAEAGRRRRLELIRSRPQPVELPGPWTRGMSTRDRSRRDSRIVELAEMGWTREAIAHEVDLSPQRVSQIVNAAGLTFLGGGDAEADSTR